MAQDITLDKEVFKALAGETRVQLLKALLERRKTQSELAKELHLSPPTIKDHLDILLKTGLVREMDDGHKWKYIELTIKGKGLFQLQDNRILVLLGTSILGVAVSGYLAYTRFFGNIVSADAGVSEQMMVKTGETISQYSSAPLAEGIGSGATMVAADAANQTVLRGVEVASQAIPIIPTAELAVLVLCLVVFGISVGMWIKNTY